MPALRIDSLTRRFGSTVAVSEVSLTVERGQLYGLLGPNGSGKTTTLRCAVGLLRPDAGRIEILGRPAGDIHRTAGRVGVVFDATDLVPGLSVRQNLEYARRLLGHQGGRGVDEALEIVGMGALRQRRAGRLSLGQGRRVAIARALLGRPELLILDEPLSGLDTPGVRAMLELFVRLREQGLTLVLSSHRLPELERIVTHVGVLLRGRVRREAALDDLLGGRQDVLRVQATPLDQARRVLAGLEGLGSVHAAPADGGNGLRVDAGRLSPAGINRALVEAGCEVSLLAAERASLQAVFEALLDEELAGAGVP